MKTSQLTARRPYLLRAFYYWLLDNKLTPYLVVDINLPGVHVPMEYARCGKIVLNIAPCAVDNLDLSNDQVFFHARFGGKQRQISVPMAAILAIYARENGAGTMFEQEADYLATMEEKMISVVDGGRPDDMIDDNSPDDNPPPRGGRPSLYIVK